jgi:putative FmdB family regulatory protein
MPAYDFRCTACGRQFEITRPASDTSPVPCPDCGAETKRVFTPVGIHFKGSGFHNTDYKKSPASPASTGSPEPSCPSAGASGGCANCPAAAGE